MNKPEQTFVVEQVRIREAMDETWEGKRSVDSNSYPHFNPSYELPFPHIGTEVMYARRTLSLKATAFE